MRRRQLGLKGMLTDRDTVVKCIAAGGDPATTKVAELAEGKPVSIGADDSVAYPQSGPALTTLAGIDHGLLLGDASSRR